MTQTITSLNDMLKAWGNDLIEKQASISMASFFEPLPPLTPRQIAASKRSMAKWKRERNLAEQSSRLAKAFGFYGSEAREGEEW